MKNEQNFSKNGRFENYIYIVARDAEERELCHNKFSNFLEPFCPPLSVILTVFMHETAFDYNELKFK